MTLPRSYCFIISTGYSKKQKVKVSVASCNIKMESKEKSRTMILKAWSIKVETDLKKTHFSSFLSSKKSFYSTILSNYREIVKLQHSVYVNFKFSSQLHFSKLKIFYFHFGWVFFQQKVEYIQQFHSTTLTLWSKFKIIIAKK